LDRPFASARKGQERDRVPSRAARADRVECREEHHQPKEKNKMNSSSILKKASVSILLAIGPAVVWLAALGAMPAQAHWPNTNATKFVQMPDVTPNGKDIFLSQSPTIWADDFLCTNTGPVTDIHLWISSIENAPATGALFELSIWSDVPASPTTGPSRPGQRLWWEVFQPGQYEIALGAANLQEQFWVLDPPPAHMVGPDTKVFQYNFYPKAPFAQLGSLTAPTIYWLGVCLLSGNAPPQGWKTSADHFQDDAVVGHYVAGAPIVTDWRELRDPLDPAVSLSFSFALTTTNQPPPCCPETNGVKFLQRPKVNDGLDVLASGIPGRVPLVLADDFICTNSGPVTDIHVWGSWLQDAVDPTPSFWLGIYSDVPVSAVNPFSHPGNLLWQQWFGPGQYVPCLWTNGTEQFYDPSQTPPTIGPDTQVYYYCFFPTNPFVQQGTAAKPSIYWLSVHAQPTAAAGRLFGWKTSLDSFQDDAVWGSWTGAPVGDWHELFDPTGKSLQLAFKITTATNPCPPVPVVCPKDKTVECGTTWVFDPPTFPTNTCCGTNVTVYVLSTTTNGVCPWVITRTWETVDCSGNTNFCRQSVTVEDSLPPTFVCANDKTVACDVPWTFDAPTASDRCCTNVTVSVVSTVTNGVCPQLVTVTRTWLATDCCNNQSVPCSQKVTVQCCGTPATNKWVQWPDITINGLDVKATSPKILADDFLCTNAGPITNIQGWASWLDDGLDPNARFTLGLGSDVPKPPTGGGFSHPGRLLWSATFGPGGYTILSTNTANEKFYDPNLPGTSGLIGADTKVFRYSFTPKQPFCQQGSTNKPLVYWLSLNAQTSGRLFGWKTTTNHWNDDAVFGHVNAAGTPLGDWKDLHDPRPNLNNLSLDLAFLLNNGPPTPDCDPNLRPKFVQWPDPSTNGLDVKATAPKILADDFLCRRTGPINGITVWGSWLNDVVDTNALFQVGLWTDVPAVPGTTNYSHPGELLCMDVFNPPQTIGTSLLRYKYGLDAANLQENFYDPNQPPPGGLIGSDTQIWRYDFYPFFPSCWKQQGSPFGSGKTYWLSVSYLPRTTGALFGWKTSTNHWQDDGVFGHLNAANTPLRDWKDLHDPRTGKSLDLAFALRTFPVIGINKDLKNTTTLTANGLQIVVAGIHEITWHYDDSPPWPHFSQSYAGGNTVLQWSDPSGVKTVAPGTITHVGFEMSGSSLTLVSMNWLVGGSAIGVPIQVNHHMLGNGSLLVLNNDLNLAPVFVNGGTLEFFGEPAPLDQMNPGGKRNPIGQPIQLPIQPMPLPPGGEARIQLPQAPAGAMYALFILELGDAQGMPATMDFLQLPLDNALQPLLGSMEVMDQMLGIGFHGVPGRMYQLQQGFSVDSFFGVFTEVTLDDDMGLFTVPLPSTGQSFFRVRLLPE